MLSSWLVIAVLFFSTSNVGAQRISDSTETAKIDTNKDVHSARRATILSAVLPGAGQIYNKKYWKVPIVVGGLGIMAYVISFNQNYYRTFKAAYRQSVLTDSLPVPSYPQYTTADLLTLRDYYRQNRDLTYILAGMLYLLNILDAYVDAELFKFDISDNLSFRGEPFILTNPGSSTSAGLRLTLNF